MNDNYPFFSSEELSINEKRKKELSKSILAREVILFVGSGSSARVGYPDWDTLINELEKLAIECNEDFLINQNEDNRFTSHFCRPSFCESSRYSLSAMLAIQSL